MTPRPSVLLLLCCLPLVLRAAAEPPAADAEPAPPEPAGLRPIEEVLAQPALPMTFEKAPLATVLYTLGQAYRFNVSVDPRVTGTTLLRFNGGTLRLSPPFSLMFDAAFSPDGNVLGARTQFGDLHIWRAPSWEEIAQAERTVHLP